MNGLALNIQENIKFRPKFFEKRKTGIGSISFKILIHKVLYIRVKNYLRRTIFHCFMGFYEDICEKLNEIYFIQ